MKRRQNVIIMIITIIMKIISAACSGLSGPPRSGASASGPVDPCITIKLTIIRIVVVIIIIIIFSMPLRLRPARCSAARRAGPASRSRSPP